MLELKAKVGPKGQAVIPKPIRDRLGIRPGDEVAYSIHDGHAHLAKAEPMDAKAALHEFFTALPKHRMSRQEAEDAWEEQYADRARRGGWPA